LRGAPLGAGDRVSSAVRDVVGGRVKNSWRSASIAPAIRGVTVIVSVAGCFFLHHSVKQQESALLENQTARAGARASSAFGEIA
jgi:hypothetical protein